MAQAEYEGQKALSAIIPENVAPPSAWGLFQEDSTKAFFLTRFRNLHEGSPPAAPFLEVLKKLHQTSASPTGKFGFPVPTFFGPPPMINDWTDSWEEYFGRQLRADVSFAQSTYGDDSELASLTEEFIEKVVARLLRPLQMGGRSIKPVLCHGDLWDGNAFRV
jgi:protein-ribulosamine 3-kinase